MAKEKRLNIDGEELTISKPDKELFPGKFTKADIVDYYRRIWSYAKLHISGRPVVLQRFPDGIKKEGFYQKKVPEYYPDWIETAEIELKEDNTRHRYVLCNNEKTIAYLADQGCITLHTWLSKADTLKKPDRMILDLDPSDGDFEKVRKAAFALKKIFDEKKMPSYPLLTGSKGLHIVVPLKPLYGFDEVRSAAKKIAEQAADSDKELLTIETSKDKRGHRVFIDYLRNAYGQTSVMPYALRADDDAPVAVPVEWDEVKDKNLNPRKYKINNIFRRLAQKEDPWKNIYKNTVHSCIFLEHEK